MKRIIALALCCVMMISSSITVFANESSETNPGEETAQEGSRSITAEDIERLEGEIKDLTDRIEELTEAVKAKQKIIVNFGGGGGGSSSKSQPSGADNYVRYGGSVIYQAGKLELNGARCNATFTIKAPASGTFKSANDMAAKLGGVLVGCITTSSPGVGFNSAKVNYFVQGVTDNDNIAVYQNQGGKWVQLTVAEIRKDHVIVYMTRHGDIAFIRVPALATING